MNVVIVESPAKAKTVNKYLGADYTVLASYGHVRDLPPKDGSVLPDDDFAMSWEVDGKAGKRLSDIVRALKGADRLILATDPDREGEAISWHVLEVLRQKKALKDVDVKRVVFNAITKQAVQEAMKAPRDIDVPLVDAYLARRALDYLVGFTLSPVLWRKLPGARSAGRVQSVTLRLVCEREQEIEAFVPQDYWSIAVEMITEDGKRFEARLVGADGKKLARLDIKDAETADALKAALEAAAYAVTALEQKPVKRHPQPPFTTSTLQQEASRKLGFSASRTMQVAQRLYEGVDIGGETVGLITYMRTDGVQIADEAVRAARSVIGKEYGDRYLPNAPRIYKAKAKNAQEAHEGIRPTDLTLLPQRVSRGLEPDQARLYDLIWKRTVASQMESAELERTTIDIRAEGAGRRLELRTTGSVVRFDGFLAVYQEGRDDEEDEEGSARLPAVKEGEALKRGDVVSEKHTTEPPPRYTEATLIKKMEELGIGRPSTYASTLSILRERDYIRLDKRRLIAEDKGRLVTAFLESFFTRYVEYDFTAGLEEKLDEISDGKLPWKDVLRDFWRDFSGSVEEIKDLRVSEVLETLNELLGPHIFPAREDGGDPRGCPACNEGRLSLKVGKYGAFIGCSNYPECRYTRQLAQPTSENGEADAAAGGPKVLGIDPATGLEVTLRDGRFGPYVQLGEGDKPKRSSLPKGTSRDSVDLEKALALLALPRDVGMHPETGEPITAGIGRFGPFVQHKGVYANLDGPDEVFTVGINRAVALLAEKAAGKGRAGRKAEGADARILGEHPDGGTITVRAGRYGPYVSHGKVNATLPKDLDPANVTLDKAVQLIAAKGGAGGKAKARPKVAKPAKKPAGKKAPAKKAATAAPAKAEKGRSAKRSAG